MKMKVLVIGSSVCDVIIRVHRIPQSGEDENIISQCLQIGGCAFNVASQLKYFDIPFDLFSPIGTGVYGTFVRQFFEQENIPILLETSKKTQSLQQAVHAIHKYVTYNSLTINALKLLT